MVVTDEEVLGQLATDYVFFLRCLWDEMDYWSVAPLSDIEEDMAAWAAYGVDEHGQYHRFRGLLAPRGIGKTHLITAALPLWHGLSDPDHLSIVPSKSYGSAQKMLHLQREWLERVWFLRHMRPNDQHSGSAKKRSDRDSTARGYYDFGHRVRGGKDASVTAFGIDSQLESARAALVCADDVETEEGTRTITARQRLRTRCSEFVSIATYGQREIVFVGTYHHEESLYLELAEKGYKFRTYPLLAPASTDKILNLAPIVKEKIAAGLLKPGTAAGSFDGDCVFAHRCDEQYVAERKSEGRTYFAMQQMLIADLGDAERYPLQLGDIIVHAADNEVAPVKIAWGHHTNTGSTAIEDIPSVGFGNDRYHGPVFVGDEWAPYNRTIMTVDPAGRGKDQTGYAVVSELATNLWVQACDGLEGGFEPPVLEKLADIAFRHRANMIFVEDNFGGGMFANLLMPFIRRRADFDDAKAAKWACGIDTRRASGQKELRILAALEAPMAQHRLIFDHKVARNQTLQRQITRLTRERGSLDHDDQIDALAAAVAQFEDTMRTDPTRAAKAARERHIDQMIEAERRRLGDSDQPRRAFQPFAR